MHAFKLPNACLFPRPGIDIRPKARHPRSIMKTLLSIASALAFSICAAAAADAPANWGTLCASCHGKDGAGHTKAGKKLEVKDLTSAEYQKSFSDTDAFNSLKVGFKTPDGTEKMKSFAEKLSDDDIKALVAYVRAMAK
jgi:cytochrome c553